MPCTRPYAESYAFIQPHMQAIRAVLHPPTCDPRLHRGCPGPSDIAIHIRECPKTFSPRWPGCPRLSWARSNLRSYLLAILGRGNATATTAAAGLGPDHASSSSTIWVVASDKVKKECPALVDELMITYMDAASGRTRVRMRSSPDVMSDFAFLAAAPTVILTLQSVQVSSYGWWAALLGRATRVHMPLNLCTWPCGVPSFFETAPQMPPAVRQGQARALPLGLSLRSSPRPCSTSPSATATTILSEGGTLGGSNRTHSGWCGRTIIRSRRHVWSSVKTVLYLKPRTVV